MTGIVGHTPSLRAAVAAAALALAALAVSLATPASALAGNDCSAVGHDPTAAQYCNPTGNDRAPASESSDGSSLVPVSNEGEDPPAGAQAASSGAAGGSLPFTGGDLLALVAVAFALLAVGLTLRWLSTARRPDAA